MLNLLHSRICGSDSVNTSNARTTGNNSHYLSENLQRSSNLRSENFEENMKIEQITNGDRIAFINIRDDVSSGSPVKEVHHRTHFQKFFLQNYPDFFRNYCMCMHNKIEPDDPNTVSSFADDNYNDNYSDKYGANSFLLNRTPIIPITVDPNKFEYASQLKSPSSEERRLHTEELNRKNAQQSGFEEVAIENGGMTNRSQSISVCSSAKGGHNEKDNDSDNEDVSIGISEGKRPLSHASTATARSIQAEASSPALDSRSKSGCSTGRSSVGEMSTAKSTFTGDNLDVESEAIDTSLEHIQNENNEKLIAEETKTSEVTSMVEYTDTIDGAEKTEEIIIETQPELLLDAAYVSIQKPCEIDDNEPRSETDSISLTSTEESSEYLAMRENTAKTVVVPICGQKIINKPIPKIRAALTSRRSKIAPAKGYSSATGIKTVEMFPLTLRKFDKPREASNSCLNQLDSQNWEVTMNGLQNFVRLIRHHPDTVEAHLHAYCVALSKQVKNLRSQVSRSACQASAEFFQTHAKHLEQECEDLATQLFNRTADTNKFLRADAFRALAAMCDNLTPTKVIQIFLTRGATHQNAIVRTTTANLCSRIVSRVGCEKIYSMNREHRDKLIVAGANFLMEGSLETRNNAKALFKQLSTHPHYNRILQDVIPPRVYRNIEKALRSIK